MSTTPSATATQTPPSPQTPPTPDPGGQAVAQPSAREVAEAQARAQARSLRGTNAQRVTVASIVTTLVCLLVAVAGFAAAQSQGAGLSRATADADRVLTVMSVRTALLEADGAATNAFLVGGLEPQDRRMVYDDAITEASMLLTELAGDADEEDAELIAELNDDLTTYTSLVEAARVNNRQGYPVGVAYLDQASTLLREEMLADLDAVLLIAADRTANGLAATRWAIVVVAATLVGLVALLYYQVQMARITRRRLNVGLLAATVLMLVALVGGAFVTSSAASGAAQLRTDSYRPTLALAQAGVLVAEARTLESFTLIQRGSGQAYEAEFAALTQEAATLLEQTDSTGDLTELLDIWLAEHAEIRSLDDGGQWEDAVELAISDDEGGPSASYSQLRQLLDARVESGAGDVTSGLGDAASNTQRAGWLIAAAGLIAAVACWRGLAPRREEYR